MKNLRVKLSVLALLLGAGSAFAGMSHKVADRKWTQDPQTLTYTPVTGTQGIDYECIDNPGNCTESYPDGVNPNSNPNNVQPTSVEHGEFQ